jgi:predicted dehydrogenase
MSKVNRRQFLQSTSGAAIGAGLSAGCASTPEKKQVAMLATAPGKKAGRATANEKIMIGVVGVAGRGSNHLDSLTQYPDVEVAALCDCYQTNLNQAADRVTKRTNKAPKTYKDYRALLDNKDLDCVFVVTPPHWHPLISIHACQAGFDVYCEKPMCLSPVEGRAMVKAARHNNRVTQIGTQIHAGENYRRVVEIVRSGILGKISQVRTSLALNEAPEGIGKTPNSDPPAELDWDMWCGPLQKIPFNMSHFVAGHHRYFAETIGSWLHEMGPHIVDLAVWAMDLPAPKSASSVGGKFATDDISTIPDTMDTLWEYDGMMMTWSNTCANSHMQTPKRTPTIDRRLHVAFHGVNGSLISDYSEYELISEGERMVNPKLPDPYMPRVKAHDREFLDAIKSRELPSCDFEKHYPLAMALNLGNISYKVGRKVVWDDKKGEIVGDREANALVTPRYREPWVLPV